jgi:hypothetical protein
VETNQTLGQQRIRIDFNPSENSDVDIIKYNTAQLIDFCEKMQRKTTNEGTEKQAKK